MLFSSLEFLYVFLPVCLIGFYLTARYQKQFCVPFLTLASIFFYGFWDIRFLPLLLGSVVVNRALGLYLSRTQSRGVLVAGLSLNLLSIGVFKYADFFIQNAAWLAGEPIPYLNIILPLGISFFTFQQISYLIESYRRTIDQGQGVHGFWNYALFVTFFPQLIAGPIVRFDEIVGQFAHKTFANVKWSMIGAGLIIFSIGLAKKVLLADHLATFASPVFDEADLGVSASMLSAWIAVMAYTA